MTKFYKFLNEKNELEEIKNILYNECMPFLKLFKKENLNSLPYSGRKNKILKNDTYEINKTRKNRKPRDTSEEIHEFFDEEFYKRYGIRGRSGCVFITGSRERASNFGLLFMVVPVGKFDFLWSPEIIDLYTKIENDDDMYQIIKYGEIQNDDIYVQFESDYNYEFKGVAENPPITKEKYIEEKVKEYEEKKENEINDMLNSYTTKNFSKALKTGNEIMLDCEKYLLIDARMGDRLEKEIVNWIKKEV